MSAAGKPPPDGSCAYCTGADGLHALDCPSRLQTERETAAHLADSHRTDRDGVPWSDVRQHENEGARRRRERNARIRRETNAALAFGLDSFVLDLSRRARLTEYEHLVVFTQLWRQVSDEPWSSRELGDSRGCTRQAIEKSLRKATAKLTGVLGHGVEKPHDDEPEQEGDPRIVFDHRVLEWLRATEDNEAEVADAIYRDWTGDAPQDEGSTYP